MLKLNQGHTVVVAVVGGGGGWVGDWGFGGVVVETNLWRGVAILLSIFKSLCQWMVLTTKLHFSVRDKGIILK